MPSLLFGAGSALGEAVILGFLKTFPGQAIGYFASGQGMAGIMGTLFFIVLRPLGLPDTAIYILVIPTVLPYLIAFIWLDNEKKTYPYVHHAEELPDSETANTLAIVNQNLQTEGVVDNQHLTWQNFLVIFRKSGLLISNLVLIVFMSLTIITSLTVAQASLIHDEKPERADEMIYKSSFVIFQLCFQIGVFLGRSSLSMLKIEQVWIMSVLMSGVFIFYLVNSIWLLVSNIFALYAVMVLVGLLNGTSFVNVFYQLKMSRKLRKTEKELAINLAAMFNDGAILLASVFSLFLSILIFTENDAHKG